MPLEEEGKRSPQADDEGEASQEQQLQAQGNEDECTSYTPSPGLGAGVPPAELGMTLASMEQKCPEAETWTWRPLVFHPVPQFQAFCYREVTAGWNPPLYRQEVVPRIPQKPPLPGSAWFLLVVPLWVPRLL